MIWPHQLRRISQKNYINFLKTYNRNNFYNRTFCIFKEVSVNQIQNLKCNYISKSKSQYFFNDIGVYRLSNHWGRASNCRWRLATDNKLVSQRNLVGFAKWTDFFPNDETSNLYFIAVNFNTNDVNFYHKNCSSYDGNATLRNALQTAKIMQNIKLILNDETWAKHLKFENYAILQMDIITQLIYSNKTFIEIKRNHL